jgi:hypothetical protein
LILSSPTKGAQPAREQQQLVQHHLQPQPQQQQHQPQNVIRLDSLGLGTIANISAHFFSISKDKYYTVPKDKPKK